MEKPKEIFDRDADWGELSRAWSSDGPELLTVLGRRRVGKSFLLTRFVRQHRGVYYQATRQTELEQLRTLSRVIGTACDDRALRGGLVFPSWEAVFEYLVEYAGGQAFLLVLDEFPYLSASVPALPSIIQAVWDHSLGNTRFKLVLSGSYVTAMKRLSEGDQPLYGRRTAGLHMSPFSYREVRRFAPQFSEREALLAYGIFGGLAGHLALLDPESDLRANVARHVLAPTGRLGDDGAHTFDSFLSDAEKHYSIVRAIAEGEHTWSGIANRVGKKGSSISRPLDWLQGMGVVNRVKPLAKRPGAAHKLALYRLADPYLNFWHRFVKPLRAEGIVEFLPPGELWDQFVEPGLNDYMGTVFEEVCRDFVRLGGGQKLPFRAVRVGDWWTSKSDCQIDVVALGPNREVLLGECKWGRATARDLDSLQQRSTQFFGQFGQMGRVHYAVFSGRRPTDRPLLERAESGEVVLVSMEDLFE